MFQAFPSGGVLDATRRTRADACLVSGKASPPLAAGSSRTPRSDPMPWHGVQREAAA